jgi:TatA/E family protein of Tat protein translocase
MPFNIGPGELIIVLIIALIVVGPGKLPDVGSALGKSIREFRKAATDVKETTNLDPAPAGASTATAATVAQAATTPPAPVIPATAASAAPVAPVAAAPVAVAEPPAVEREPASTPADESSTPGA